MPMFRCEGCGAAENTALCHFWVRKINGKPLLCSACDPEIGVWHGKFDRRQWEDTKYKEEPVDGTSHL